VQVAEIKAKVYNKQVFVKERSEDIYKSIDQALDNYERQVKRIKEKCQHSNDKMADKIAV
jgi:ribosomal subunit interface protein